MTDPLITRRMDELGELAELQADDRMVVARGEGPAQTAEVQAMMEFMEANGVGAAAAAAAAADAADAQTARVAAEAAAATLVDLTYRGVASTGLSGDLWDAPGYYLAAGVGDVPTTGQLEIRKTGSFTNMILWELDKPHRIWTRYRANTGAVSAWTRVGVEAQAATYRGVATGDANTYWGTANEGRWLAAGPPYLANLPADAPSGPFTVLDVGGFGYQTIEDFDQPERVYKRYRTTGGVISPWIRIGADAATYAGQAVGDSKTFLQPQRRLVVGTMTDMPVGMTAQAGFLDVFEYDSQWVRQVYYNLTSASRSWSRVLRRTAPGASTFLSVGAWTSDARSRWAGKKVVILGDSRTEGGDWPVRLAQMLDCEVVRLGFGGCRMGRFHPGEGATGALYDQFCAYRIAARVKARAETGAGYDWSPLLTAADDLFAAVADDNRPQAALLAALDPATVAAWIVDYQTNDFVGPANADHPEWTIPVGAVGDLDGTLTFAGAVESVIRDLSAATPRAWIGFKGAPFRARQLAGDGKNSDDFPNLQGAYLRDYFAMTRTLAARHKLPPPLDVEAHSGINALNWTQWISDGVHEDGPHGWQRQAEMTAAWMESWG
jgi:hypothetical protein